VRCVPPCPWSAARSYPQTGGTFGGSCRISSKVTPHMLTETAIRKAKAPAEKALTAFQAWLRQSGRQEPIRSPDRCPSLRGQNDRVVGA